MTTFSLDERPPLEPGRPQFIIPEKDTVLVFDDDQEYQKYMESLYTKDS